MTNREKLKKVIKNDFDKENNYKKIVEGMNDKRIKFNYKYATIPTVVIIIFVLITGISTKNNKVKQLEKFGGDDWSDGLNITTSSNTNHIDTANSDSSIVEINEINDMIKNRSNTKIVNNVNIPYLEILTNLEIPNDFDNKEDYRAVYIKDSKSSKEDYILNNYEFHYKNTKNEREIVASFSKDFIPISNYNFGVNSKLSLVNGIDVLLYKYEKTYIAKFEYMKYNFLIEGNNITQDEFMNFVSSIIK